MQTNRSVSHVERRRALASVSDRQPVRALLLRGQVGHDRSSGAYSRHQRELGSVKSDGSRLEISAKSLPRNGNRVARLVDRYAVDNDGRDHRGERRRGNQQQQGTQVAFHFIVPIQSDPRLASQSEVRDHVLALRCDVVTIFINHERVNGKLTGTLDVMCHDQLV